jgi:general secretion pathway protein G
MAAYTLFEIMLVLAIIAVLLGSAIYMLGGQLDVAKVKRVDADAQTFGVALRSYEMMSLAKPTTTQGLAALAVRPTTEPVPKRWIKQMEAVPMDPWNHPYNYYNPGKKNQQGYDFFSSGPDGIAGNDDDIWPQ